MCLVQFLGMLTQSTPIFSSWALIKAGQAEVEQTRGDCLLLTQLGAPEGIAAAPGAASSSSDAKHSTFSILAGFSLLFSWETVTSSGFPSS